MAFLLFFCGIDSCFSVWEYGIMREIECSNQTYLSLFWCYTYVPNLS